MNERIKVLLVDDHKILREGYQHLLEASGYTVVGQAGNSDEGYNMFSSLNPDISIIDMTMPGAGGIDCINRIYAKDKNASILVCSMHSNPALIQKAINSGAKGYISKSCSSSTLIKAIKEVTNGKLFLSNDIASSMAMDKLSNKNELVHALSNRELSIFIMIAKGNTISEISKFLSLSPKTVSNYKSRMMHKLNITTLTELISLAQEIEVI